MNTLPPILQVGDVLISSDIIIEQFCCDLSACHGACCVEGDAGAPVTLDEVAQLEDRVDEVWDRLSAGAKAEINAHGIAYTDQEGDLVTSIVDGGDCVFTFKSAEEQDCGNYKIPQGCTLCLVEDTKPISCALYPIREKNFGGTVCLNYHRWAVCRDAVRLGRELHMPVYKFLRGPLIRRFGEEWYEELCEVAEQITSSQSAGSL